MRSKTSSSMNVALATAVWLAAGCASPAAEEMLLAPDVRLLWQSEVFRPEADHRQGRSLPGFDVVDIALERSFLGEAENDAAHLVFLRRDRNTGGFTGFTNYSSIVFHSLDRGSTWNASATVAHESGIKIGPDSHSGSRIFGLANRHGVTVQVLFEPFPGGRGTGAHRVYQYEPGSSARRRPGATGGKEVEFTQPPRAVAGQLFGVMSTGGLRALHRMGPRDGLTRLHEEASAFYNGASSADGVEWVSLKNGSESVNGVAEYEPTWCWLRGALEKCESHANWPHLLTQGRVHQFSDASAAIVEDSWLLPFGADMDFSSFVELAGHEVEPPASPTLRPRYGGALPVRALSPDGSPGPVRYLDHGPDGWEEVVFPTDLCRNGACPEGHAPELLYARPLGGDEWILAFGYFAEGSVSGVDSEGQNITVLGLQYNLYARRAQATRKPWTPLEKGLRPAHLAGRASFPAGVYEKICEARRACLATPENTLPDDELCWPGGTYPLSQYDPGFPAVATLIGWTSTGATCEQWLSVGHDEAGYLARGECDATTGRFARCEGTERWECTTLPGGEYVARREDCALRGSTCLFDPKTWAVCGHPTPARAARTIDRIICQQGRYLTWSAPHDRLSRHWLDCAELGFNGCEPPPRVHGNALCRKP